MATKKQKASAKKRFMAYCFASGVCSKGKDGKIKGINKGNYKTLAKGMTGNRKAQTRLETTISVTKDKKSGVRIKKKETRASMKLTATSPESKKERTKLIVNKSQKKATFDQTGRVKKLRGIDFDRKREVVTRNPNKRSKTANALRKKAGIRGKGFKMI